MAHGFTGFDGDLMAFLTELGAHNERAWFEANRARYERSVREPARAFIRAMAPRLARVSPYFVADDRKAGGSLMRVHRDTRFSRDKRPYKTNLGIQFRHEAGKDVHAPGFYFHVEAGSAFLAAGVWHPDSGTLGTIRARIDEEPERWLAALGDRRFRRHFRQSGESLKNPPRGFSKDHPLLEDLKRTDHIVVHEVDVAELGSPRLVERAADRFGAAGGYVRFVCEAIGVRF